MDIGAPSDYREPGKGLRQQHDFLARLAQMPEYKKIVIPFATVHPDREGALDEVKRCVECLGFRGFKIYPRLGYTPDHPVLMDQIFPYLDDQRCLS